MLLGTLEGLWIDWIVSFRPLDLYLYCPPIALKFIGRFEELLGTGRGIYFESINTKAVLGLIHGCHETVAGIQLKPTINY